MVETFAKLGKLKVNYKEFGDKKANFGDVLILHGWGGKSDSWLKFSNKLSKKGFRIIVPDLPGFGKTKITKTYNLSDYAQVIEEFVKKLKLENIILWGHSNGGAISITLENRGKIDIDRLILNNSAGIRNDKKRTKKRKVLNYLIKNLGFLKKIFIFKKIRILFYKLIGGTDYLNAEKSPYLKQTYLNMISSDLQEKIKQIEKNTLIIWGENDIYTPLSDGYFMRNNIKNSKMIVLDNETHGIHIKNPKRLVKTFLDNI